MSDEVADAVETAADVIEKYGWIQGRLGSRDQGFCIRGAFVYAECQDFENRLRFYEAQVVVGDRLREEYPSPLQTLSIEDYNDKIAQDQQEVLDKLRGIAKEIRG